MYCVKAIKYLLIFVNTKVYVTKILLNCSQIIACVATVMMLLETATINKYWCNNKINKTTTTDK